MEERLIGQREERERGGVGREGRKRGKVSGGESGRARRPALETDIEELGRQNRGKNKCQDSEDLSATDLLVLASD